MRLTCRIVRAGVEKMPSSATVTIDVTIDVTRAARVLRRLLPCDPLTLLGIDRDTRLGWRRCWIGSTGDDVEFPVGRRLTEQFTAGLLRLTGAEPGADAGPVRSGPIQYTPGSTADAVLPRSGPPAARLPSAAGAGLCAAGLVPAQQSAVHGLLLPVCVTPDRMLVWLLERPEPGFDPVDLAIAAMLLPGLRASVRLPFAGPGRLTERESHILELVAGGLTAAAVSRRCGISTRTVHKHLENAYRKLGCHDRVTAVLSLRELAPDEPDRDRGLLERGLPDRGLPDLGLTESGRPEPGHSEPATGPLLTRT